MSAPHSTSEAAEQLHRLCTAVWNEAPDAAGGRRLGKGCPVLMCGVAALPLFALLVHRGAVWATSLSNPAMLYACLCSHMHSSAHYGCYGCCCFLCKWTWWWWCFKKGFGAAPHAVETLEALLLLLPYSLLVV